MFAKILAAIDPNHPESWKRVLPLAAEMAEGAELHVVSVVPDFGAAMVQGYFPPDFERKALERGEADLEKIVAEALPADAGAKLHLEHGSIRTHVLKCAERIGADLIVMASHHPDQMREFLVGSHADWIVRHAPMSVLVVRD